MTDTPPVRISWSSLRVHGECRQKSYLMRSGKSSAGKDLRSYFHGMVVDRAMVDWLHNPRRTAGAMKTAVDDLIDSVAEEALETGDGVVRWRHRRDRAELREFCVELVDRLEPILVDRILPYPFQVRRRFAVPVTMPYLDGTPATVTLTGEMDLLLDNNGWEIWDLKGTRDNDYWRKVLGQLIFYDLANLCLHGVPSRLTGLIQPMCTEPVVEFVITNDQRAVMWTRIQAMASDIWSHNVACKETTGGCNWCEVKHACPRYQPDSPDSLLATGLRHAAQTIQE